MLKPNGIWESGGSSGGLQREIRGSGGDQILKNPESQVRIWTSSQVYGDLSGFGDACSDSFGGRG